MGNDLQLPYSAQIPGGMRNGIDVVIYGRAPLHSTGFSINLCQGPTNNQGCAFHFNPRFNQNCVVRNSMQGGVWAQEERGGGMPIFVNQPFQIFMEVKPHGYHVTINNVHFCDFYHRVPKESVRYIYIDGEVIIESIQFGGGASYSPPVYSQPNLGYPSPAPAFRPAPAKKKFRPAPAKKQYPGTGSASGPIFNPRVPFTGPIENGLYPGRIIFLTGIVNPSASRFTINLQCGPNDAYDIALHFDVRIRLGTTTNDIIRTHRVGGNWGPEERGVPYFPFAPNGSFEIMILVEDTCFKIAVNNQHMFQFNHRIQPFYKANHLTVTGDVKLNQIRFQ